MFDEWYIDENGDKKFDGHTGYLNFWPAFLKVAEIFSESDDRL